MTASLADKLPSWSQQFFSKLSKHRCNVPIKVSRRQATDWTSSCATAQLSLVNTKCWISEVATSTSWGDTTSSLSCSVTPSNNNNNHTKLVLTQNIITWRTADHKCGNHYFVHSKSFIWEVRFENHLSVRLHFYWISYVYTFTQYTI